MTPVADALPAPVHASSHRAVPVVVVEADAPATRRTSSALSASEARVLRAFADANGLAFVDVPADAGPTALPVDPGRDARIARVEGVLHAAREPIELGSESALDRVRATVAAAYAEIRAHPEDPEAPLLLGEALRTLARIEARAGDDDAARALRRRADVVDGGRRIGLSEGGSTSQDEAPPLATVPVRILLDGAGPAARVVVDGVPREPGTASLAPGEHHVRVVSGDASTLLARWVSFANAPAQELALHVRVDETACSPRDLSRALASTATAATAPFAVSCARWARVVRRAEGLELRLCDASSCGAATTLSTLDVATTKAPRPQPSVWRSGWTWAAIGAAAVATGVLTAWGLGAFDPDPKPPPTWRWEGVR